MCDPVSLTLGGTALAGMAGSTFMNKQAADRVNDVRTDKINEEAKRQAQMDAQAQAISKGATNRYANGAQDTARQEQADTLSNRYQEALPGVAPGAVNSVTGRPQVVMADQARKAAEALKYGRDSATAMGKLRSWDALSFDNNQMLGRDASKLGVVNSNRQASSGLLGNELAAANQAGQGSRTAADIFGALGQGAAMGAGRSAGGGF